jgi:hypothetical protein
VLDYRWPYAAIAVADVGGFEEVVHCRLALRVGSEGVSAEGEEGLDWCV